MSQRSIDKVDYNAARMYAKMNGYRQKEERTLDRIKQMLDVTRNPYISLSCGKDSSVMAHMILRVKKIDCRFLSSGETRILHNVDDVLKFFSRSTRVEEINIDRVFSPEYQDLTFNEQRKMGNKDIQSLDNAGYGGVFIGLRMEESNRRKMTCLLHTTPGLPMFSYKYAHRDYYRFCPIADWKTIDVAAYIAEHHIPYLDWYEREGFQARTTARITGDAIRQNVLAYIQKNNFEGWARLVARFPEIRDMV